MSTTPKKILVAVDFEPSSLKGLDRAIDLAQRLGSVVVAFHAVEIPVVGIPDGAFVASPELAAALMTAADKALKDIVVSRQGRGADLTGLVRTGVAWETIHEVAEELDVELIVMGTHGRRGLVRALLGSVAEKTVRTAKRPVLVVHS